jgi:hypothetical protein
LSNHHIDGGTDIRGDHQETDLSCYILQNIDGKSKLIDKFLCELTQQFQNNELSKAIGPTIIAIGEHVACLKFNENYQPAINVTFNDAHR